jgi:hypothetical protein
MQYVTLEEIRVWCQLLQTIALIIFVVCFVAFRKDRHAPPRNARPSSPQANCWVSWRPAQEAVPKSWQATDPEAWSIEAVNQDEEEEDQ